MSGLSLKAQEQQKVDSDIKAKADIFYLDAVNQRLLGNHAEAFELYRHVLSLDKNHVGANYDLSSYYHAIGKDGLSGESLKVASDSDPNNYWVKMALVQLYASEKQTDKAIKALEEMAQVYPENSNIIIMLEEMYSSTNNYDKVVEMLDRLETLEGKTEQISREKYRIYKQKGDDAKALAELESLSEEYPNDMRYKVLVGDMFMGNHQFDEAYKVYSKLYAEDPNHISVQLALAGYYETVHNDTLYQEMLGRIVTNDALSNDMRLTVMQDIATRNLFGSQQNDTARVMNLFDRILKQPQENTQLAELCARYMISSDMPKERIKPVLYQMLDIDPETDIARNQLLIYAIQEDNDDDVQRLCKTAVDYSTDQPIYYYYLGVVMLKNSKYKEAIDATEKGLAKTDAQSNVDMVVNMYNILGDSYHRLGDNTRAYECYDSCLLYKPNDVLVLNNYAYYLAVEKKRLDKAEEMASKAIEIEKDNPTYIDTYAWVLFQQRRYQESKVQIDRVLQLLDGDYSSGNSTLLEHAGDIYSKCGDKAKAMEYWKIAKELGSKSSTIDRKISKKRYVEF